MSIWTLVIFQSIGAIGIVIELYLMTRRINTLETVVVGNLKRLSQMRQLHNANVRFIDVGKCKAVVEDALHYNNILSEVDIENA